MKINSLSDLYEMHYPKNSECTLKTYRHAWNTYKEFMKNSASLMEEEEIINKTTWSTAQLFKNSLLNKGLSPKSVNAMLSGLRSYFDLLILTDNITENPFKKIKSESTKGVDYERPYLNGEDFDVLIQTIATKEKGKKQDGFELTSARDELAVGILLSCGLRIHELLKIKINEIQPDGTLMVIGKGNKLRKVFISPKNMERLEKYLVVREKYAQNECEDLFISRYGKLMSAQSFNKNLKKYLERANLDTNVSAHGLRASSATDMLRRGVRVTKIASLLGHEDVKTTLKHYAKESDEFDFLR